jgi:ubiquinone/menaquinone biosynthesis C-methylase UbiE
MNDNFAHRAADWDQPSKVEMTKKFVNALLNNIEIKSHWKAFEVGAGTGLVGLQIADKVDKVVFEDTSEAMLEVLKQKPKNEEKVEIVHGEVFEYVNQDIDFVFSCMAFHHIPDIEKSLKHLYQITNPEAIVAVGDIRTEDGSFHSFEPIPHKGFDTEELAAQFDVAGFKVLTSQTYNVLKRERTPGVYTDYEQFMLIAKRK